MEDIVLWIAAPRTGLSSLQRSCLRLGISRCAVAPAPADTPEPASTEVTETTQAPEQPDTTANTTSSCSVIDDIIAASLALRVQRYFRLESELIYDNYTEFTEIQVKDYNVPLTIELPELE